ncbi:PLD nuclease N-terminal domain-containing protein [Galbitalea soli]|uniref:Cardiolipin synthase N-terminal domain-containing protein n=1 Tax=Galbitalea soli TaxID=1268042 RepID=A0A7C9PMJ3_9MICO|nr:PLD nuclease N-terminal domain-containing protein [Galbitalea soli]NEM91014.1 hypothetical protein [Galbitalea soli]NYJ29701.1 hypothetical protein [Galbitalea soli]
MIRFLPTILVLAVDIYALVDVLTIHEWRIKSLNKFGWVVIILVLPLIGAILWFTIGRERTEQAEREAGTHRIGPPRVLAPDDDPVFLQNTSRLQEQEERIRRLEAELKALGDEKKSDE